MKLSATHVVIGGGIAAFECANQLAKNHPTSSVLVISASALLKVTKLIEQFKLEEQPFEALMKESVRVIQGTVVCVNSTNKTLETREGHIVQWDNLCVCSGGQPKRFHEHPDVLGIRDTETVNVYKSRLATARRIIVVGNGGIALEIVGEIRHCDVIWSIKDDYIGNTFFDLSASAFLLPELGAAEAYGSSFESNNRPRTATGSGDLPLPLRIEFRTVVEDVVRRTDIVGELDKLCFASESLDQWPLYIKLSNGLWYGCDFVVSATGVSPCADFLGPEFLRSTDGGVIVNRQMETNVAGVFAAGDVCHIGWSESPNWFQMRLWDQARMMGIYAAYCMAPVPHEIAPVNFDLFTHMTSFFGKKVILLGRFNAQFLNDDHHDIVRIHQEEAKYIKFVLHRDRLVGAMLIGETDLEETAQNLIMNGIDLSSYGDSILDENIDLEDYFD